MKRIFKHFFQATNRLAILCLSAVVLSVIFSGAINYALAVWKGPTQHPPEGNVEPPINTSSINQDKKGGLNIATVSGNVGIGTTTPAEKLVVSLGNVLIPDGKLAVGIPAINGDDDAYLQIGYPNNPVQGKGIEVYSTADSISGHSDSGSPGIYGSGDGYGVYGYSGGGYGVYGKSEVGVGVYGEGGRAGYFLGPVAIKNNGSDLGKLSVQDDVIIDGNLEVKKNTTIGGALLASGNTGAIPIEGGGSRLMWYPAKSAFRAGYVYDDAWNNANIGWYSVAMGTNTVASEMASTALGASAVASHERATAIGINTTASGDSSMALGVLTTASGWHSTAMGNQIIVSGSDSFGIGLDDTQRTITQDNTMAIMGGDVGIGTTNPGAKLEVMGNIHLSSGDREIGIPGENGGNLTVRAGRNLNDLPGGSLYLKAGAAPSSIGGSIYIEPGAPAAAPGNVVLAQTYGNVGIGTALPGSKLTVTDGVSIGSGYTSNVAPQNGMIVEGNVGIGTSTPTEKLEVAGNVIIPNGKLAVSAPTVGDYGASLQIGDSSHPVQGKGIDVWSTDYSIYGHSVSKSSSGVYGSGAYSGVSGYSMSNYGVYGEGAYGIYGTGTEYAGYFNGNVGITKNLTVGGDFMNGGGLEVKNSGQNDNGCQLFPSTFEDGTMFVCKWCVNPDKRHTALLVYLDRAWKTVVDNTDDVKSCTEQ